MSMLKLLQRRVLSSVIHFANVSELRWMDGGWIAGETCNKA